MGMTSTPKFIVDTNAGKLVKWLRIIGYDTLFFKNGDDSCLIAAALAEKRVILTRDTHIIERRIVTSGQLNVILLQSDNPEQQMKQVIKTMTLNCGLDPFMICLECNQPLLKKSKQEVKYLIPPYVYRTQNQYMACPACCRIYWRGTHWQKMTKKLNKFLQYANNE
ncbi:MAG: Mut7-C RNAse domain-containing protein [Dehalococcoidales bacterium]|nr:Mut7-C RNAse domain-containing protein [Dehalococcoidales bacterium]